jgi:ATP synthase I chain
MDSAELSKTESEASAGRAEEFYSGALQRISNFMIGLAVILSAVALLRFGWRITLGFVCGCALAHLNFHWLKRVVNALGERMSAEANEEVNQKENGEMDGEVDRKEKPKSGKGVVVRFLLRYFLMGLAAYAIFTVSRVSLYGLFAGLFLPVAGIACEAAYEAYAALARGL